MCIGIIVVDGEMIIQNMWFHVKISKNEIRTAIFRMIICVLKTHTRRAHRD